MAPNRLLTSRAIIGEFYNRLTVAPAGWIGRYAMKISSNQASESYGWLGMVPTMREWVGGRQAKDLRENGFNLANKDHEATLEINVSDLRRDASGQILVRIGELANRAQSYPAKLMSALIINAESTTCYDGQYFFDTDHSEGNSGSQSNDISYDVATPTKPTVEEMRDAILAGIQQVIGLKDDQGEPMNEGATQFEVMVPISLWGTAVSAVSLQTLGGGATNILPNLANLQIVVVPNVRLTWTDRFAIFRTDGETKPFILQEELPISVDAIAEGSELEFKEKKHWYGVQWAGNVGYGYWQHACLVTLT
ncbi:Mu-like prophage major head subunit gpT [Kaistia soli DSM 19436]|uniref:Mu-like prophage major head subunit gpT n=1 Tax=Kaistia soli DSM 19436 TaxID=1122133 RepID=A0A1M4VFU5_9HYPH|nr:Mu-like prophage major head subunit gpT family protein [Kaistia soli]SHE67849.1 Mu-like prophage major head subunit gpT [Kaistia soli DSM 19436]